MSLEKKTKKQLIDEIGRKENIIQKAKAEIKELSYKVESRYTKKEYQTAAWAAGAFIVGLLIGLFI